MPETHVARTRQSKVFRDRSGALVHQGGSHPGLTPPPPRPVSGRLAELALRTIARLPLRAAQGLGASLAAAVWWLPLRERHVTRVNLEIAFPDRSGRFRRRLARASWRHTGRTFAELGAVWTWSAARLDRLVREVSGEERLRDAYRAGKGVILALPHLGPWEILGPYCAARYPLHGLYRAPRMREMERFVRAARERHGANLIPAGPSAARGLYRALRRGEVVAILPDQDAGEGQGVFVPFFSQPANTMVLLSRLASRTGATVLLMYAERLPRGAGFHLRILPVAEEVGATDVEAAAGALNREIERAVRELPEQYLWSYKRFRIRPPGSPDPYAR